MSYSKQYTDSLQAYLELKERKALRAAEVEDEVRAQSPWVLKDGSKVTNLDAGIEHVIHGRQNSDPLLKEIQVQMDRAAAEATMYGIGAIIRNLAFLAKKEGK